MQILIYNFLYKEGIIPRKIYDTMIAEQVLYLGYPPEQKKYSLADIALFRLNKTMDKSIRTNIARLGFCESVIRYGAKDVTFLEDIAKSQIAEARQKNVQMLLYLNVNLYLPWLIQNFVELNQMKQNGKPK